MARPAQLLLIDNRSRRDDQAVSALDCLYSIQPGCQERFTFKQNSFLESWALLSWWTQQALASLTGYQTALVSRPVTNSVSNIMAPGLRPRKAVRPLWFQSVL